MFMKHSAAESGSRVTISKGGAIKWLNLKIMALEPLWWRSYNGMGYWFSGVFSSMCALRLS